MSLEWPQAMTEGGRLSQSDMAQQAGLCLVLDPRMSCPQTLDITLFFDGTNNNDDPNNAWRDSLHKAHTNVARLRNMAIQDRENGSFMFYAPGVGTPFPDIDEKLYTTDGKAFAAGFNQRCVWGYAQVLNAVYYAIRQDPDQRLINQSDLAKLCNEGARDHLDGFKQTIQRLKKWLREHATEFGLTNEDGNPNETGIDEAAKVANWRPTGDVRSQT